MSEPPGRGGAWTEERGAGFATSDEGRRRLKGAPAASAATLNDLPGITTRLRVGYTYLPGLTLSGFLRGLGERRIEGGRCTSCSKVYIPPRVRCPACGTGPMTPVPVGDRGTIVSYTVVHVPVAGSPAPPFAWAWIRLDGADVPFPHLLGGVAVEEIIVGQHVRAVWAADDQLSPSWESILHFAPVSP